jgi:isochorismate pyruvate lyase
MKSPQECSTIDEVRKEIDTIDRQVVELLGKRAAYVNEIIRFKSNKEEVEAKKRYDEVLQVRRQWAAEQHLSPDIIETIYKILIQYFIDIQIKLLEKKK